MVVRALLILLSVSLIIAGLFGCSEAPFDPNVRGEAGLRGDINLDGLGYTIADAVMFSNYFIQGLDALIGVDRVNQYSSDLDRSIAASDTNADGRTLDLADLVYLIQVVVGDAWPNPSRPIPVEAVNLHSGSTLLAVDAQLGAAYVIIAGDNVPFNLTHNMDMKSAFDGVNTHVLVWSMDGNSFSGEFLGNVGEVISVELATAQGGRVVQKEIPTNIGLSQNYPNPFYPTTTIVFSIPTESDYLFVIKNSTNKIVLSYSGHVAAGFHSFEWDATGNAAGFYYATLTIGDWQDSIKMMLMR